MIEILKSDNDDTNTVSMLYEASVEGNVVILNSLIEKDPLILRKISLTPFVETPLHISAQLGHLEFTKQLLTLKPKLASELDSHNRSPLHLASAEGHAEIVRALLEANKDMCSAKDQDGRIPLHHAAMRGRLDVIELLLLHASRELIFEVLSSTGETVLHLCVKYNHLEALKLLVISACPDQNNEFLNTKELESGNTILHLAVMLKQIKTVEYLLSIPQVEKDAVNKKGDKASNLYDDQNLHQRDFISLKIQQLLTNNNDKYSYKYKSAKYWLPKQIIRIKISDHLDKYNGEWLKDIRGSMMVVATVIATITFTAAVSPPGGVWGSNYTEEDETGRFNCSKENPCYAGTSVLAHSRWYYYYLQFVKYNSTAFLASLSVILLLISGFPVTNRLCLWLLTVAMCVTLTFMTLSFRDGLYIIAPYRIEGDINMIYYRTYKIWVWMLAIVAVFHTLHFLIWLLIKLWGIYNWCSTKRISDWCSIKRISRYARVPKMSTTNNNGPSV